MIDIFHKIKNDTDTENYNKEVMLWQNEQKRQFEEFIIDDQELENRLVYNLLFLLIFTIYC